MIVREVCARSILSKSKIYDYTINAYTGCQHACTYCYARFMKRTTGHIEPWGEFVDVKINAPELLQKEITKKTRGGVWISGVCDAYQPLEAKYKLTRKCLEILVEHDWPITIQTKSPLVLWDIDVLSKASDVEVGFTITTADDNVRRLFEPNAPPIEARIKALDELHQAGIRTFAMIAPMLPGAEELPALLAGKADHILIDRMNYHYSDWVYRKYNLEAAMSNEFIHQTAKELADTFEKQGIDCRVVL
ncbi:MAG: radical SAM protein [Dehalococcoidia bacterium]|nr:radical SAM protein [Dehalococcoidia bacterium]